MPGALLCLAIPAAANCCACPSLCAPAALQGTTINTAWLSVAASVQARGLGRSAATFCQRVARLHAQLLCTNPLLSCPIAPSSLLQLWSTRPVPSLFLMQLLISLRLSFGPHLEAAAVLAAAVFTCLGAFALIREHDTGAQHLQPPAAVAAAAATAWSTAVRRRGVRPTLLAACASPLASLRLNLAASLRALPCSLRPDAGLGASGRV